MPTDIAFNRNYVFTEYEKEFITTSLKNADELKEHLKNDENQIYVINPIHHSDDDVLPYFTFRIFNKSTEICDIPFLVFDDFHGYVWTEQDGSLTLDFITQFKNDKVSVL